MSLRLFVSSSFLLKQDKNQSDGNWVSCCLAGPTPAWVKPCLGNTVPVMGHQDGLGQGPHLDSAEKLFPASGPGTLRILSRSSREEEREALCTLEPGPKPECFWPQLSSDTGEPNCGQESQPCQAWCQLAQSKPAPRRPV